MREEMEDAIKRITSMIVSGIKADDAMKYAQAALNLSHAINAINYTDCGGIAPRYLK